MKRVFFAALAVYTAALLAIELQGSQAAVRPFFTDLTGEVPLYGINTTLNAFLLFGTALVFALCFWIARRVGAQESRPFFLSQVLVFGYLGFDERFLVHEFIGSRLPVDDAFVLLAVGVVEAVLLLGWGRLGDYRRGTVLCLLTGAVLFVVMSAIDRFAPLDAWMRLSLEDLSKLWATVFLFLFGLHVFRDLVNRHLQGEARLAPQRARAPDQA